MKIDDFIASLRAEGIEVSVTKVIPPLNEGEKQEVLMPLSRIRGCLHVVRRRYTWKQLRDARWQVYGKVKGDMRFRFRRRRSLGP